MTHVADNAAIIALILGVGPLFGIWLRGCLR